MAAPAEENSAKPVAPPTSDPYSPHRDVSAPDHSHRQSALIADALSTAGISSPLTREPFSEAMLAGLAGGIGFMYAVFQYRDLPPICTLVLRYHPHDFVLGMLTRAGLSFGVEQTASTRKAHRQLLGAAQSDSLCLATIGIGPSAAEEVVVWEADEETVTYSQRAHATETVSADAFSAMRSSNRAARNRLIQVAPPASQYRDGWDAEAAVTDAIEATHTVLTGPVLGHAFDVNFGLSGMERFASALADRRTKSGWLRTFGGSATDLSSGLRRVEACIQREFSAWGGMRPLYADFLSEVVACGVVPTSTDAGRLGEAAVAYQTLGTEWAALGDAAATAAATVDATGNVPERDSVGELLAELAHRMSLIVAAEAAAVSMLST